MLTIIHFTHIFVISGERHDAGQWTAQWQATRTCLNADYELPEINAKYTSELTYISEKMRVISEMQTWRDARFL